MVKYISLKFEPESGTPFDYLINVEGLVYKEETFYNAAGSSYDSPLSLPSVGTSAALMDGYIQGLISDALQRPGNESFVVATDGPAVITEFA